MNNRFLVTGLVILLVILLIGYWVTNQPTGVLAPTQSPAPAIQRLDEITNNPEDFISQQVTVQGEVDDVIGRNTIVLDVPGEAINDEILVVSRSPISESVAEAVGVLNERQVRLTGTVNEFVFTVYRDTLDPDIQPDLVAVYEGRPFILTDSITVVEQ